MSRVAIVTGASRGIGAHVADALEQAGYAVERGSRSGRVAWQFARDWAGQHVKRRTERSA